MVATKSQVSTTASSIHFCAVKGSSSTMLSTKIFAATLLIFAFATMTTLAGPVNGASDQSPPPGMINSFSIDIIVINRMINGYIEMRRNSEQIICSINSFSFSSHSIFSLQICIRREQELFECNHSYRSSSHT